MDNFFVGRFRHGCLSLFRRRGLRDQAGISPNGSKRRMVFCLLRAPSWGTFGRRPSQHAAESVYPQTQQPKHKVLLQRRGQAC